MSRSKIVLDSLPAFVRIPAKGFICLSICTLLLATVVLVLVLLSKVPWLVILQSLWFQIIAGLVGFYLVCAGVGSALE